MGALDQKIAIVTGASRGIGRAIAIKLAAAGAKVIVNYTRSTTEAQTLALEIGGLAVQADIAVPADIHRLWDSAEAAYGGVDILVNNAGIAVFKPVAKTTEQDFDETFALNTRGAFFCAKEAALRLRPHGRIVNISTGATVAGSANGAIYCGSKAALEQLTRALARELGSRWITVNTVSPGFTDTDMLAQYPDLVEMAPALSALGRVGKTEDVADVVAWLCSEESRWITGQNLQASGGVNMV